MEKIVKIAISGGGISSLCFVHGLQKSIKEMFPESLLKFKITIFQRNAILGGRIYSPVKEMANSVNQFDVGANLIDFDQQNSKDYLKHKLGEKIFGKLKLFKKDLLIYQKFQLRKGDYQKERYFYQNGFQQLLNDLLKEIKGQNLEIRTNCVINQNKRLQNGWCVFYDYLNQNQESLPQKQNFDFLVLSHINSQQNFRYTKQISVAYRFQPKKQIQFSSILFKDHPISFLCSHQEKYPKNSQIIGVFQTSVEFSQQNFNQSDQNISDRLFQRVPDILREDLGIVKQNYFVHRWAKSLFQSISKQKDKKYSQILSKMIESQLKQKVYMIGDSVYQKSRVSNAMKSGYSAADRFVQKTSKSINL